MLGPVATITTSFPLLQSLNSEKDALCVSCTSIAKHATFKSIVDVKVQLSHFFLVRDEAIGFPLSFALPSADFE